MAKLKKMILFVAIIAVSIIGAGVLFLNLSPEFGGKATEEQQRVYSVSDNYIDGKFINKGNVNLDMSFRDILKALKRGFKSNPNSRPKKAIEVQKIDSLNLVNYHAETRFIWFGHSTFLVQMNDKNILIDPMFGDVPAPNPIFGGQRFSRELPIEVAKLPQIDAVLISHDHYDHLDYGSIQKLKDKVKMFYTPLGVGIHLQAWGVDKDRIIELDWWQETKLDDLVFRSTPSQHFSGRGLSDRDKTLWCSWIVQSETENIFFSGDGGYAPHFKAIGERYGPFDFAMIECGQYNKLWPDVHMFPEETAQAGVDLKSKIIMPIHWGAFKLSQHSWTDPVERLSLKAKELQIELVTPQIGESYVLGTSGLESSAWWKD